MSRFEGARFQKPRMIPAKSMVRLCAHARTAPSAIYYDSVDRCYLAACEACQGIISRGEEWIADSIYFPRAEILVG